MHNFFCIQCINREKRRKKERKERKSHLQFSCLLVEWVISLDLVEHSPGIHQHLPNVVHIPSRHKHTHIHTHVTYSQVYVSQSKDQFFLILPPFWECPIDIQFTCLLVNERMIHRWIKHQLLNKTSHWKAREWKRHPKMIGLKQGDFRRISPSLLEWMECVFYSQDKSCQGSRVVWIWLVWTPLLGTIPVSQTQLHSNLKDTLAHASHF